MRSTVGQVFQAWRIESERLRALGASNIYLQNRVFHGFLRSGLVAGLFFAAGGWLALGIFLLAAAWVSIKAIVQARVRGDSAEFKGLSDYLRSDVMRIDGFKGVALNFRPWNNQLRQPILLATHDAVLATAPVEEFLHQVNVLDTLGIDEEENTCRFH